MGSIANLYGELNHIPINLVQDRLAIDARRKFFELLKELRFLLEANFSADELKPKQRSFSHETP